MEGEGEESEEKKKVKTPKRKRIPRAMRDCSAVHVSRRCRD